MLQLSVRLGVCTSVAVTDCRIVFVRERVGVMELVIAGVLEEVSVTKGVVDFSTVSDPVRVSVTV